MAGENGHEGVDPTTAFEGYRFGDAETVLYSRVFDALKEGEGEVAHGSAVAEIMRQSNVPDDTLGKVWDVADRSLKGYLTRIELFIALRAVAFAQKGQPVTIERLAGTGALLPTDLPRLGEQFPSPTTEEVALAKQRDRSLFPIPGASSAINPQFNVKVLFPVKHEGGMQDHMTYGIDVHCTMGLLNSTESVVYRRYSDFEWLRNQLLENSMGHVVPPLPEKKYFGRFEKTFLDNRRQGLEAFLNALTSNPQYVNARPLITFLQADDETFAKAKTAGPSLLSQVVVSLTNTTSNVKLMSSPGVRHTLPTDAKLEDFANRIDELKVRLKETRRVFDVYLASQARQTQACSQFLSVAVPPTAPLALDEVTLLQHAMMNAGENKRAAEMNDFGHVLSGLMAQIKAMQEVILQRKSAHKKYEALRQRVEAKQLKRTNTRDQTAMDLMDREINSLTKEGDAARHRYDTISKALEEEIVSFEERRRYQMLKALQSMARLGASHAAAQKEQWQGLQQRMRTAHASTLACTVDVPPGLLVKAEPRWVTPKQFRATQPPGGAAAATAPSFAVGAPSKVTIPQHPTPPAADPPAHGAGPGLSSSLGSRFPDPPTDTGPAPSRLPAYASAFAGADDFVSVAEKDDEDRDDFIFSEADAPAAGSVPTHWSG